METKKKRKTYTSTAVKRRYNEKVYSHVMFQLRKELVADFKKAVADNGTSMSAVVRSCMEQYVAEHKQKDSGTNCTTKP